MRGGVLSTFSLKEVLHACWPLTKTRARNFEVLFDRSSRVLTLKWIVFPCSAPEARMRPEGDRTRPVIPAATLVFIQTGTRPCTQCVDAFVMLHAAWAAPRLRTATCNPGRMTDPASSGTAP